jgi:hypothetical protein
MVEQKRLLLPSQFFFLLFFAPMKRDERQHVIE